MASEQGMLRRFAQAGPLTWLLATVCGWAVLLWLGALLGMGGRVDQAEALPAGALPQPKPASPDRIGALGQYAEAAARPLFTDDRRPRSFLATGSEGDQAAQVQTLDFILTGVLISPQVRLAILQPTAGGNSQRVRVGNSPEGAGGWRLIDVQPRRAVFEGGGGQSTLDLRTFGAPGMPPQAVSANANANADAAARAAADAQGAAESAAAGPPLPPPTPAEQARIEELRKRIEARRAQLRANQTQPATVAPNSAPGARTQ